MALFDNLQKIEWMNHVFIEDLFVEEDTEAKKLAVDSEITFKVSSFFEDRLDKKSKQFIYIPEGDFVLREEDLIFLHLKNAKLIFYILSNLSNRQMRQALMHKLLFERPDLKRRLESVQNRQKKRRKIKEKGSEGEENQYYQEIGEIGRDSSCKIDDFWEETRREEFVCVEILLRADEIEMSLSPIIYWCRLLFEEQVKAFKLKIHTAYFSMMGGAFASISNFEMAYSFAKRQVQVARELGDLRLEIASQIHISYFFISKNKPKKALSIILQQKKVAERMGDNSLSKIVEYALQKWNETFSNN